MKTRPRTADIDWDQVRGRLAAAAARLAEAQQLPAEKAQRILEDRARALAQSPSSPLPATAELELVTFHLANEHYAIETRYVHEVFRLASFTPVPGTPDYLVGVTNLRGDILTIIDLRRFFGVPLKGLPDLSRVVVIGEERAELGLLADTVEEVMFLRLSDLLEAPDSVEGIGREYLKGVTSQLLIVLDGEVLLHDARLVIDQNGS